MYFQILFKTFIYYRIDTGQKIFCGILRALYRKLFWRRLKFHCYEAHLFCCSYLTGYTALRKVENN
ncbi:hypothetical protein BV914_02785 [Neisseria dumasiana]|uniref:Uncharacterized protein n=1 Tax=Neisseria dumasiana TaxID=1931275 RepID=A0A1X3DL15_9NEIS|nr:hypothetical protein BV914_02785 [Neisseria dumasiana]OSI24602.1 hypothetical protein BV912_01735 [Neisseria dumasiana]